MHQAAVLLGALPLDVAAALQAVDDGGGGGPARAELVGEQDARRYAALLISSANGIAGLEAAEWMQGSALPVDDADAEARGIEAQLTAWDSELFGVGMYLRTITRDGWVCTAYLPGAVHDGTEGELYCLAEDPLQQVNRWDDPAVRALRDDLLSDLRDRQPVDHQPRLELQAPV